MNGSPPLPAAPLEGGLSGVAEVTEGRVGLPLGDSCSGEAADAPSSYGNHPTAMAEGQRVESFCVLGHVHFEDFEDDLRPACKPAAHFAQGDSARLIQISVNDVHWAFDLSQHHPTETAQAPLLGKTMLGKDAYDII